MGYYSTLANSSTDNNNTVQQTLSDKNIQDQKYDAFVNFWVLNPNTNSVFADQVRVFLKMHLKFFTILAKLH